MKNHDKEFLLLLWITAALVAGNLIENTLKSIQPKENNVEVDIRKVTRSIEASGIIPREALHWKEL